MRSFAFQWPLLFVNSTVFSCAYFDCTLRSGSFKRDSAARELLTTERSYNDSLKTLMNVCVKLSEAFNFQVFVLPLKLVSASMAKPFVTVEQVDSVFSQIPMGALVVEQFSLVFLQ